MTADLAERFARLRVQATSPDGTVTAWFGHRGGFGVELKPGRTDEGRLSREVTAAIAGTRRGYRQARERLNALAGGLLPGGDEPFRLARERDRENLVEACDGVEIRTLSPERYVRVTLRGAGRVECDIRPGALAALPPHRLAAEITAAYDQARAEHGRALRDIGGRRAAALL